MAPVNNAGKHLALLRGINVGGHNLISKTELRSCFEELGFEDVSTYIQSGNVLFRSKSKSIKQLIKKIEQGLSDTFDYAARAVVFSAQDYNAAVSKAHQTWGRKDGFKHNAMFLLPELTLEQTLEQLPKPTRGIETVSLSTNAIFWSADTRNLGKTTMMKLSKTKLYKQMTVRNHKTTFKLQELLDAMD